MMQGQIARTAKQAASSGDDKQSERSPFSSLLQARFHGNWRLPAYPNIHSSLPLCIIELGWSEWRHTGRRQGNFLAGSSV